MKFFILMVCFVSSLSASTVSSLFYYLDNDAPKINTDLLKNELYLAKSHQDRRLMKIREKNDL